MKNNLKIGIIVADREEYTPLADFIKQHNYEVTSVFGREAICFLIKNTDIIAVNCGIGKVNAAVAATALIDKGCNIIFNYGLSGGIGDTVRGSVVIPEKFIEHDFDLTGIGYKPCEKPDQEYIYQADNRLVDIVKSVAGHCIGSVAASGDHFVCSKEESAFLQETFSAVSCDMETAAIAYVCNVSCVPFVAVRKISDNADDSAAENYREMNSTAQSMPYEIIIESIKKIIDSDAF